MPGLSNVLDAEGIKRITGLADLLPAGATEFGAGNIIIGGGGSDQIWGNGADDIIDGDKWLNVRLSVRDDPRCGNAVRHDPEGHSGRHHGRQD